ncbi:type II toxin-antitoxin system Y4mF family antitoxin [Sinomonas sp.]|uniref:type II toxin-antitoxin system Y4mF family antitoxin n=1 Tax=Sinomonas sp. TaxID=1914986 RepID=UPI003F80D568
MVGDTMARIAAAVRDRRRALELTQQDVADLAGVSERFVRFVEQSKPSVRLDALAAVLDALGLALDAVPSQKMSHKAMP